MTDFLTPDFKCIPAELREVPAWVVWLAETKPGQSKLAKVPYNPKTGRRADPSNPNTGGSFDEARALYERGNFTGVGLILHESQGLVGIDLDKCVDPQTEKIEPWAETIIDELDCYVEFSPSGSGVRLFAFGKIPPHGRRNGSVEIYDSKRFLTVTGRLPVDYWDRGAFPIQDQTEKFAAFHREIFGERDTETGDREVRGPGNELKDPIIIAMGLTSPKFKTLWEGDPASYPSRSEGEMALVNMLAYLTAGDPDRMMELFRQSGLYEEKCERTVPRYTIPKAIEGRAGRFLLGAEAFDIVELESRGTSRGPAFTANNIDACIKPLEEFVEIVPEPRQSLLHPWLKEKSIALVWGERGVGKSWFIQGILKALTTGGTFGPWSCPKAVPCLYLDAEMVSEDTTERFKGLLDGNMKAPLYIYSADYAAQIGHPSPNLENEVWREEMKKVLVKLGVKVFVIDNLSSLTAGDENTKEAWSPINKWLLSLRFAGISIILVHHANKEGGQRGTSAREDNIDISICLSRPKDYLETQGARFKVKFTKSRIPQKHLPLIRETEFSLETDKNGSPVWTNKDPIKENWIECLKMLNQGMTQKDIALELGLTAGRISQMRKDALGRGLLDNKGNLTEKGRNEIGPDFEPVGCPNQPTGLATGTAAG